MLKRILMTITDGALVNEADSVDFDLLRSTAEGMVDRLQQDHFAEVKIAPSEPARTLFQGRATIVYDTEVMDQRGDEEYGEFQLRYLTPLMALSSETRADKPAALLPNTGRATPWRFNIFIC
jgi:hypothetical protein